MAGAGPHRGSCGDADYSSMLAQAETQPYNSRTESLVKLWSDPGQTWHDQKGELEGWVSGRGQVPRSRF